MNTGAVTLTAPPDETLELITQMPLMHVAPNGAGGGHTRPNATGSNSETGDGVGLATGVVLEAGGPGLLHTNPSQDDGDGQSELLRQIIVSSTIERGSSSFCLTSDAVVAIT
jgi:hypothetical protein